MAPKRSKKSEINENIQKYNNLLIEDVLCPICRSILVEPVTLPCSHCFCLACFNGTMENNALTCPLCRIRIGSWLRTATKEKKVINHRLWQVIQHKFSDEVKNKLDGEDEISVESIRIQLANPGEIRREYEAELQKERTEATKKHEAEEKASEVTIRKILEEEQNITRIQDEKLRLDEELARRLSNTAKQSQPCCSHVATKTGVKSSLDKYLIPLNKKHDTNENNVASRLTSKHDSMNSNSQVKSTHKNYTSKIMFQSRAKKQSSHAYKHLLLTKSLQCERANSNGSDSGDSIHQEMRYFKPIRTAPKSVPKTYDGNIVRAPLLKIPCIHPVSTWPVFISAPQTDNVVRIRPHTGSAFVACGNVQPPACAAGSPPKQVATATDSGKMIKQYYNKKKNAIQISIRQHLNASPNTSPWLGFSNDDQMNDAVIITGIMKSIDQLSGGDQICVNKSTSNTTSTTSVQGSLMSKENMLKPPKKKLLERSLKKVNGCDTVNNVAIRNDEVLKVMYDNKNTWLAPLPPPVATVASSVAPLVVTPPNVAPTVASPVPPPVASPVPPPVAEPVAPPVVQPAALTPAELRLQEQLDYEFAKRLHEELNNPRTRAFMTLKAASMQNKAKRQVTLDELIPPKKFKI